MADTISKQAYDKMVETWGAGSKLTKDMYESVKGYIDVDKDGNVSLNDAYKGATDLGDNIKGGLNYLGDQAKAGYKAAVTDGGIQTLWGEFTKNPVNMVMAGAGALLAALLFSELGIVGLVVAMIAGAAAFGGLSTYLNQPSEQHSPSTTPGDGKAPEKGGDSPSQEQSQGKGKEKLPEEYRDGEITAAEFEAMRKRYDLQSQVPLNNADTPGNAQSLIFLPKRNMETGEVGPIIIANDPAKDPSAPNKNDGKLLVIFQENGQNVYIDVTAEAKYTGDKANVRASQNEILAMAETKKGKKEFYNPPELDHNKDGRYEDIAPVALQAIPNLKSKAAEQGPAPGQ